MALKITLKPNEKVIVGGAVLTNGNSKNSDLIIENSVPVLRQKDILCETNATSHCRQIYFVIQLMYIDSENLIEHQHAYWKLLHKLIDAIPRLTGHIDEINEQILIGNYYRALKLARQLIHFEQEVLKNADPAGPLTENI